MGAGAFAAGKGFGGADPVLNPALPPVFRFPDAIWVDLALPGYALEQNPLLSGQTWRSMDPVDQAVLLSFLIRRGTYAPAPEIGHTLHQIPRSAVGEKLVQEVIARVRVAQPFADMVRQGFAEHVGTEVRAPKRGEKQIVVEYRNLRALGAGPQTLTTNLNPPPG